MNTEILEQAFDDLGQMARDSGLICEIAVYGGASLMLATDARDVTKDVDAAFLKEGEFIANAAKTISGKRDLPQNWLNEAIAHMVNGRVGPPSKLTLFGEYPRDDNVPGLRVHLPTPEYILAMKLIISQRDDIEKASRDRDDVVSLMRITKRCDKESMLATVRNFFPTVKGVDHRIIARIEDAIARETETRPHDTSRQTWNAQRGR
ncbi:MULTISPECIES: hypothetical protein [Hyphomicrobiales]|jgi:hypothetical protein|uniref:hypothetical protein n=1 Tax=Methylobacterium sp. CCH7-A2 TaxID=1768789 RepID=UPI000832E374|nr:MULTISPECIES: hypothetical protein [Hyphomicrobiales]